MCHLSSFPCGDLQYLEQLLENLIRRVSEHSDAHPPMQDLLPRLRHALSCLREIGKRAAPVAYVPVHPVTGPLWAQVSPVPTVEPPPGGHIQPLFDHVMDHAVGQSLEQVLRACFTLPRIQPRRAPAGSEGDQSGHDYLIRNREAALWFLDHLAPILERLKTSLDSTTQARLSLQPQR